ncbi:Aste57867_18146 [Aphanomyces stellatus]|uniref:Aste57867_18146 protein n=1 Tax=Aphanomyces stellatus TaxID=120398 RepID=A0A485LD07_9STRA|nr:hypothetical protein As57867_018084 [Aphanomyces stellatus]VFT94884.1 Aste57867_18146 [Aphanomyces stellatus]
MTASATPSSRAPGNGGGMWSSGGGGNAVRFVHNECSIDVLFKTEYIRNNRSSGHKNVRCFPHCCGAHRESTFCGSSITVQCSENVVVYGRFEESEDNSSTQPQVTCGTTIGLADILGDEKTASNPFGMWMVGVPVGNMQYEINKSKLSWHYGWVSSRFNSKTLHRFQVYVFQHISPQQLKCCAMIASPSFSLCSSRKTRKKTTTPAPSVASTTTKTEPVSPASSRATTVKSEPIATTYPPPPSAALSIMAPPPPQQQAVAPLRARMAPPPPIKVEMPSMESILRSDPQRPHTFSGLESAAKRLKASVDDTALVRSGGPPSPTPSTFSFSSFLRPMGHTNNPSSPVPSTTNSCAYSFSSFMRGPTDNRPTSNAPPSPVPSSAPSLAFSFSSFLRPMPPAKAQSPTKQATQIAPGSPVPSSVPSGVVTLFSDLIKDDFCRKAKECKRISRYDYVDRALCLSRIHRIAGAIIDFAVPDGTWDNLAESQTPLQGFMFRTNDWQTLSIYECRPREHKTDETYEQVLTFCINAMRHCIRTGMIGRLRSFLHSHASSIFKPELLDKAYADFITFFEREIESYIFPRKRMQCAAFLEYLRHNLPLEMIALLDPKESEPVDNEPLGYFELVTQLRQVYQYVKSEEQPVDSKPPSHTTPTPVTGRWERNKVPTNTGTSWFYRVLGANMLKYWTLVETPTELLMKFDNSLIPQQTPYLLNGDPMFLSFSPIGMSSGGMQGRAMSGYKAWRNEENAIVLEWHNWPRGKNGIRRRFTRTLVRSPTDEDLLLSHSIVEESAMSESDLKSFSELNLSERINFPGDWKIILEEDSTMKRRRDDE